MNDLRFAFRQLRQTPGFTIIAIITLALGIGANTAIFSVIRAVLLNPLPFPAPEKLVVIGNQDKRAPDPAVLNTFSFPDFFDLRSRTLSFAEVAAYREKSFALFGHGEVQSVRGQRVTGELFSALGVSPLFGRVFTREDEKAGGGANGLSVVLSHQFWQREFSGDRNVIGQQFILDGQTFTVIGVMPATFQFPIQTDPTDLYVSTAIDAMPAGGKRPNIEIRTDAMMRCLARLKPGVTLEQAQTELHAFAAAMEKEFPDTSSNIDVIVRPMHDQLVVNVRVALWILCGAVACVLLIASVNVANLLLARASVRRREIALRAALGASRLRLIRQLLVESLLLAGIGGALGLLVAVWGTQALIALVPKELPRAGNIHLDALVVAFTLGISLATGIIFGLAPALHSTRIDLNTALKAGSGGSLGATHSRLRDLFLTSEIAIALILLVGAGLLLRSFHRLGQAAAGLQSDHLLTARFALPANNYPQIEQIENFYDRLQTRLRALPGVRVASTVFPLPMSGAVTSTSFDLADHPLPLAQLPTSLTRIIGADYFTAMGIPLLRGRTFSERDRLNSKPVVMINERFAEKYFPSQDPIGRQMKPFWSNGNDQPLMREIIGVVANARHGTLADDFAPEIYVSAAQIPYLTATILLRTETSNPAGQTSALRAAVLEVDPNVPLTAVRAFDEYRARSFAAARFNALLLSIFGVVALLLTAVGIYGVIAYSVSRRTSEIGIRLALGAQRSSIFRLVVGQSMTLVAISIAIGLLGALASTRLMTSLLYSVGAWDPATFILIAILIGLVALLASWIPASRAANVDPITALRAE